MDEIHNYDESAAFKELRLDPIVTMLKILAVGKGRPTRSLKMELRCPKPMSENSDVEASSSVR